MQLNPQSPVVRLLAVRLARGRVLPQHLLRTHHDLRAGGSLFGAKLTDAVGHQHDDHIPGLLQQQERRGRGNVRAPAGRGTSDRHPSEHVHLARPGDGYRSVRDRGQRAESRPLTGLHADLPGRPHAPQTGGGADRTISRPGSSPLRGFAATTSRWSVNDGFAYQERALIDPNNLVGWDLSLPRALRLADHYPEHRVAGSRHRSVCAGFVEAEPAPDADARTARRLRAALRRDLQRRPDEGYGDRAAVQHDLPGDRRRAQRDALQRGAGPRTGERA